MREAIQILRSPQEHLAIDQRGRCVEMIVERVGSDHLERRSILEHRRGPLTTDHVDATGGADRRREHIGHPLDPLHLISRRAGLGVEG